MYGVRSLTLKTAFKKTVENTVKCCFVTIRACPSKNTLNITSLKNGSSIEIMQYNNPDEKSLTFSICPIPINQQPVYQYRILKDRKFFRWATLSSSAYTGKLLAVWAIGLLFTLCAIVASPGHYGITVPDLLWGTIIGNLAVIFCALKLYAVWYCLHSGLVNRLKV